MNNPTTGFLCQTSPGVYQDLSGIFQPLNGKTPLASATGFCDPNDNDLNTIFLPLPPPPNSIYKSVYTGFLVNNIDLNSIFTPCQPFTISGTPAYNYYIVANNGKYYYEIYLFYNTTTYNITFNTNLSNVQIIAVGGGGSGGYNASNQLSAGGGGGGGGGVSIQNVLLNAGQYNVTVGNGGFLFNGNGIGGSTSFTNISNNVSVTASGGNPGASSITVSGTYPQANYRTGPAPGGTAGPGGGNGGNGGIINGGFIYSPSNINPINGANGTQVTLSSGTTFFVGGGGGGGAYTNAGVYSGGGLGGGGGISWANSGASYPNFINSTYPNQYQISANTNNITGYSYSGGGGAGQNGQSTQMNGGSGGRGLVVLCFQWP
jgi:hypothetical protein